MRTGVFWVTTPCSMANSTFMKFQSPGQMGQTQWMDVARDTKKIYRASLQQTRPQERPKGGWKDEAENDVRTMGIVNW